MDNPSPGASARAWFDKAGEDLGAAEVLLQADPPRREAAAFHCQQAAEKYLKGFLAQHGEDPPRTHDLTHLLHRCSAYEEGLWALYGAVRQLYPYAVDVRYPFTGWSVSREEAADALMQALHVRDVILALFDR